MAGNVVNNLKSYGIDSDFYHQQEELIKQRFVDDLTNHTFLRVDNTDKVKTVILSDLLGHHCLAGYDCIIISDYCKGFLSSDTIRYVCNKHNNVILETKKIPGDYCKNASFIKMNESEYEDIKPHINESEWESKLIVTLGDKGTKYRDKIYPVKKVEVFDLCGAGDTWLAAFAFEYTNTWKIEKAIELANDAAVEVVQRRGVVAVYSRKNKQGEHELVKKLKC